MSTGFLTLQAQDMAHSCLPLLCQCSCSFLSDCAEVRLPTQRCKGGLHGRCACSAAKLLRREPCSLLLLQLLAPGSEHCSHSLGLPRAPQACSLRSNIWLGTQATFAPMASHLNR